MIPFNANSPHVLWFRAWREHIRCAKASPSNPDGYCQAAMLAQAQYVMYLAIEMAKNRKG